MHRRVLTIFAVAVLGTLIAAVTVTAVHRSEAAMLRDGAAAR